MRLLGLDFETTGLSAENDSIIEVGAVVWCTEKKAPLIIDNYFVNDGKNNVTSFITSINGISQENVNEFGVSSFDGLSRLLLLLSRCEVIVAHNGNRFDKLFMKAWIGKHNLEIPFDKIKWIDTLSDVDYPPHCGSRKLTYLAADHGFINPFAHRAVFDVLTMMRVLDQYPITEIIETMNQPTYIIEAVVSFQNKELARERFFRWDGVKRKWLRSMKKNKWEAEEFPFDTNVIDEGK